MVAVTQKKNFYLSDGTIDVNAWLIHVEKSFHLKSTILLQKTINLACIHYQGLTTFYGQSYLTHSIEIAEIMLDLISEEEAISAAIIHNAIEKTSLSITVVKEQLGEEIAKLVNSINQMKIINTPLSNINKNRNHTQIDKLRKTFLAMASDIRVVLIKLAEQTCIMRGIKNINETERKRIAQETLDIYAPLANRLGIGQLKWELEDLAFHYIDPDTYKMIAKSLAERRIDREKRIQDMIARLKEEFTNHHIHASFSGRAKHIYSIFLKMQKKYLDYKNIYDASAIRILVPNIEDCYQALSIVHHLWEHIPAEFDDYIANPKPNGYRSIHTAVISSDKKHLEIQIRTSDMHKEAEHGIAAHWLYKEKKIAQPEYETKITFLRQLLSWHKELITQNMAPYSLDALLEDSVYVFTPHGDIIDLIKGATPLDFAYHIHSDVGNRCRGAKVNGHIVPLTYQLQTGDRIEVITSPNGVPSRDWLNKEFGYIKTSRARAKVAQWFRQQETNQYIEAGKNILEKELTRAGIAHIDLQKITARLQFKNINALLSTLGHGSIRPAQIIHAAQIEKTTGIEKTNQIPLIKKNETTSLGPQVAGITDLLTRLAKCCKPIPGDDIIGYITQGRGISIHHKNCKNLATLLNYNQNRVIYINWDNQKNNSYYVDLQIITNQKDAFLRDLPALLATMKLDLIQLHSSTNKNDLLFITITIKINEKNQFQQLISDIKKLPYIFEVRRLTRNF